MLPHAPYEFLASGQKYLSGDGSAPAGVSREVPDKWIGEEPLILTAYHRYLQQIGYVDRFIGQLRHSLKTTHLYDNALIIITADHGVSFRQGMYRRHIEKGNAGDILRIPMIVKLPGQREGKISQRLVGSVDILPTIIDVLKGKTSWNIEGRSMFEDEKPPRKSIEITGIGQVKAEDLTSFPGLKWQTNHFPGHSSLDHLGPKGLNPSLIGQALSNLSIGKPGAMRVFYPDLIHFEHVNPGSGFVPALIRGAILETNTRNLWVAVALNGRIWATTQTVEWNGNDNYLSVLFPPTAFKRGRNLVGVYLIDETEGALVPIPPTDGQRDVILQYETSGRGTLLYSDGSAVLVEAGPQTLRGHIDIVHFPRNLLVLEGWAGDIAAPHLSASALIFVGEQLVAQVKPENDRPDVVKVFQKEGLLKSGFRVDIPLDVFRSIEGETRVIVVSQGQRAVPLRFNAEQKMFIRGVREKEAIR